MNSNFHADRVWDFGEKLQKNWKWNKKEHDIKSLFYPTHAAIYEGVQVGHKVSQGLDLAKVALNPFTFAYVQSCQGIYL